jgi:hypothetical protein
VVSIIGAGSPDHARESPYYSQYFENGESPIRNWLVLEILGILVGGFISGAVSGRLTWRIERSPKISRNRRLLMAFLGGLFFCLRSPAGKGVYERCGTFRNGCTDYCRIRDDAGHFRIRLRLCMVLQKKLDLTWDPSQAYFNQARGSIS